jgi:hypothetical protein
MILTPKSIFDDIASRPLAQRDIAKESYKGIEVPVWGLKLTNVSTSYKDKDRFRVRSMDDNFNFVIFESPKISYPQFNLLHANEKIWVKGTISRVDIMDIVLENATVYFTDPSKKENLGVVQAVINNSQIHYGKGDNVIEKKTSIKNHSDSVNLWESPIAQIITGIAIAGIVYLLGWS